MWLIECRMSVLICEATPTGHDGCHPQTARYKTVEAAQEPIIQNVSQTKDGVIVSFSNGDTALFRTQFQFEHRNAQCNRIIAPDAGEEIQHPSWH